MTQRYFLGANSERGFYSLYDGFPPSACAFLHIIKGGPGTGKSSFMRAIGQKAEQLGQEVHYVLCSGDPDSLDGVYLPELKQAWVDGTAPHVLEPRFFEADSDYVNLGSFCRGPIRGDDARRIRELVRDNKRLYRDAYRFLGAAASLLPDVEPGSTLELQQLRELLGQSAAGKTDGQNAQQLRFLHAISCQGELWLTDELLALCPRLIRVSGGALSELQSEAAIRCPSPLSPERSDALLFPEAGLALIDRSWPVTVELDLRLCAPPNAEELATRRTAHDLLDRAVTQLRRAKSLHDELESIYQGYMDFPSLSAYVQETLKALFNTNL